MKIPQVESTQLVNGTGGPLPLGGNFAQFSPDAAAAPYRGITQLGGAIADTAEKFEAVQKAKQEQDDESYAKSGLSDEQRAVYVCSGCRLEAAEAGSAAAVRARPPRLLIRLWAMRPWPRFPRTARMARVSEMTP